MIKLTNNTKDFFERQSGEIFIYGAGNAGYWVGYYMNLCNIEFSAYLDKKIYIEGSKYNNKPVVYPQKLEEFKGKSVRIVVTPKNYEEVLADLLWLDSLYDFHALCLVPRFVHVSTRVEGYHINKLLSYFRRKLLKGDIPTIVSNNCAAGFIYDLLDCIMLSPTINTGIEPDDFLKLCKNPRYYFDSELGELMYCRPYGNPQLDRDEPVGRLRDIFISFCHMDSVEGICERWNLMSKKINWDRLIFIACEHDTYVPFTIKNERDFLSLPEEKLLITMRNTSFWGDGGYNKVFMQQNYLAGSDSAIENYFDLLGWINQDYKDT